VQLPPAELSNYPNPFNPATVLEFGVCSPGAVNLSVFDVRGQRVLTLIDEELAIGTYRILWNGRDADGDAVAAGVYYCRLETADRVEMKKLVLVK
jgi:flagellar hook assembly protein FlgD